MFNSFLLASVTLSSALADTFLNGNGWQYWCYGPGCTISADSNIVPQQGFQLEGGGTDIEEAFTWTTDLAQGGNWLCIRAYGSDAYNDWIYNISRVSPHSPVSSAATLLVTSATGANDPTVSSIVKNASVIFFAGGDQSEYVDWYNNTQLLIAVQNHVSVKRGPLGGTSAGLAIQGQFLYTAQTPNSLTSAQALADPYSKDMTLGRNFLSNPLMRNIITDTHFCARDRMGRSITFAARLIQDRWADVGVGVMSVDQYGALLLNSSGVGRMVQYESSTSTSTSLPAECGVYTYMLKTTVAPNVCAKKTPLSISGVNVWRLAPGDEFDVVNWRPVTGGINYILNVVNGVISAVGNNGQIY
jgi:cyanophycinase